MKRRPPNLTELLGTALLQLFPDAMTFEEAKALTPKQIVARFRQSYDVHHHVYVAIGGSNHPTNLSWLAAPKHDERTRKIDVPAIAKLKRGAKRRAAELIKPTHAAHTDAGYVHADDTSAERVRKTAKRKQMQGRGFQKKPPGMKRNWKTGKWERLQ